MARRYGYIPLHSIASDTAPALSPESTLFAKYCTGVPDEMPPVRGLAPETQVGLSRYSVTIKLCDSYCLGIGDYQVVQ